MANSDSINWRRSREWQRFWTFHMYLAVLVLAGESLLAVAYFLITPTGSHREVLLFIGLSSFGIALGLLILVSRLATREWRNRVSLSAALLAGFVLTVSVYLDSGLDSPLIFLMALPIISAALALPTRAVVICCVAAILELSAVAATDPRVLRSSADLLLEWGFMFGVAVLSVGTVRLRAHLQSEDEHLLTEITRVARTDALTGCVNHGAFYEQLDSEINRALRHKEPLSLLVADVDLFKAFNDAYGHAAGDAALALVGYTMRKSSRSFDTVARIGGDEFAVILPRTSLVDARDIAQRLSQSLGFSDGREISLSVGFATLDTGEPTAKRLFHDADEGLYKAKTNGRSCSASISDPDSGARHSNRKAPSHDTEVSQANEERLEERVREANRATMEALSMLDTLQSAETIGFGFIDCEFRIVRINPMLAAVNGGAVEDQIGRTVREVAPELWPRLEPMYQAVLDGSSLTNQEVVGETASDPERPHFWLTNLYPVRLNNEIIGIEVVAIDVTDRKHLEESQAALTRSVVAALAASVELRDPYTAGHQQRVARIAVAVAEEMALDPGQIEHIELAATIHDLGKLAVPAEILSRPGRLTAGELQLTHEHAQLGADLLGRVGFPDDVRQMVLQHHERLDGSGYPSGLVGNQILLGARIIAVADVLEAMSSHRPYRAALGAEIAIKELEQGSGARYDAQVVDVCLRLYQSGRLPMNDSPWTNDIAARLTSVSEAQRNEKKDSCGREGSARSATVFA